MRAMIPVEVWKCLGKRTLDFLNRLFNTLLKSGGCLRTGQEVYKELRDE